MIFGTDGVRDRAGEGLLAAPSVDRIVEAIAAVLERRAEFPADVPASRGGTIYIGRDTRESGVALFEQVASKFQSLGHPVCDLGVMPTAGVAHAAARSGECCLAVMLSASHNPASDNGIKLIAAGGSKASTAFETAVSDAYHEIVSAPVARVSPTARAPRRDISRESSAAYVAFLVSRVRKSRRLAGKRVALDAANGAAYRAAPEVFRALGMEVELIAGEPDGRNINAGCGAMHPERLASRVVASGARLGFCFDGDADRMIPVTGAGKILDGDYVMALCGRSFHRAGKLPKRTVVATVMSNLGLEKALAVDGLRLLRTPVGDRNVYDRLVTDGHPFGGEQSGHLIFIEDALTGDGILAALRLLDVLESDALDLDTEASIMTRLPQILRSVVVRERVSIETVAEVAEAIAHAERALGGDGRVLVRYSGTEPLLRVMLEGPSPDLIGELCERICRAIRATLAA